MRTTRPIRQTAVLALLAALAVAACGSGATGTDGPAVTPTPPPGQSAGTPGGPGAGSTAQPGPAVDGCTFLTESDIKAVTTYTVASAASGTQLGIFKSGCEWELVADEVVPPSIVLGIMTEGGKSYYDTYFKPFNEEQGFTPVAGIGDEAVEDGYGSIMVVSGDTFFDVEYLGDGDHANDLARKVVAHL